MLYWWRNYFQQDTTWACEASAKHFSTVATVGITLVSWKIQIFSWPTNISRSYDYSKRFGVHQTEVDALQKISAMGDVSRFVFSWAWQINIVNSRRPLAWLPILSPLSQTRTNLELGVVSYNRHLKHWSINWVRLQCFDIWMSLNPFSCIRTWVHWVWEQFLLRMMILAGSMLLLKHCKATKTNYSSYKEEVLARVWDIPHFDHIFWLAFYFNDWPLASTMANESNNLLISSLGELCCSMSLILR